LSRADDADDRRQQLLLAGTRIDGVHLRVFELTGRPGDIMLLAGARRRFENRPFLEIIAAAMCHQHAGHRSSTT